MTVQNVVLYGLSLLLSPLYALYAPKSIILGAIERGVYQPGAMAQVNNNITRETAIAVISRAKREGKNLAIMAEVILYLKRTHSYSRLFRLFHAHNHSKTERC